MNAPRFSVHYFVNDKLTSTLENCTAEQAYTEAIPGEATLPSEGNRWHVMMRYAALDHMQKLQVGQSMPVAWQDPHPRGRVYDTERIVIIRDAPFF